MLDDVDAVERNLEDDDMDDIDDTAEEEEPENVDLVAVVCERFSVPTRLSFAGSRSVESQNSRKKCLCTNIKLLLIFLLSLYRLTTS